MANPTVGTGRLRKKVPGIYSQAIFHFQMYSECATLGGALACNMFVPFDYSMPLIRVYPSVRIGEEDTIMPPGRYYFFT